MDNTSRKKALKTQSIILRIEILILSSKKKQLFRIQISFFR